MSKASKGKSQVKGNGLKAGMAAPSALRGTPEKNRWDVTAEATREAEAQMDKSEPFIQQPIVGTREEPAWPAIYGVDLKAKRREQILRDVTAGSLRAQLGDRQVMLDDKTIDWLISEQDRIFLIEADLAFEAYARDQGLFKSPSDLQYARKIYPGYFSRRDNMAEWLSTTQMKLYQVRSRGIQSEDDFKFCLLIQGLPPASQRMINTPVHELMNLSQQQFTDGLYQKGAIRQAILPKWGDGEKQQVAFAGLGAAPNRDVFRGWMSSNSPTAGEGLQGTYHGLNFMGGPTLGGFTGRGTAGGAREFQGLEGYFQKP